MRLQAVPILRFSAENSELMRAMDSVKRIIVNADDFGLSAGVNRGIIQAHERGILTSASLMVRQPGAAEAARYARGRTQLSVGLHVDLCEWRFLEGEWRAVYERVSLSDASAVAGEVDAQLALFRELMGCDPTHLDSHQHVHRDEPIRSVLLERATRLGVPLRSFSSEIRYCGDFYGQSDKGEPYPEAIAPEALIRILRGVGPGITEVACHPGFAGDFDSVYAAEREVECKTLCDPQVRSVLEAERLTLCCFATRNRT